MAGTRPAMTTFGWFRSRHNNPLLFPGQPCSVSGTAFKLNGSAPHPSTAPRRIGADTVAILEDLGYDGDRITELALRGIIATGGLTRNLKS